MLERKFDEHVKERHELIKSLGHTISIFGSIRDNTEFGEIVKYFVGFSNLIDKYVADSTNLEEIKVQLVDLAMLGGFMSASRKVWIKPSGDGSQSAETFFYKLLAETTLKECKKLDKRNEE